MNGVNILADTNIFIHLKNGDPRVKLYLDYNFSYSDITEIELLGVFGISKKQHLFWTELFEICNLLTFEYKIKAKIIELKKKYKIKMPDAIIAATAIVHNIPLLTCDFGFSAINELDLILIPQA